MALNLWANLRLRVVINGGDYKKREYHKFKRVLLRNNKLQCHYPAYLTTNIKDQAQLAHDETATSLRHRRFSLQFRRSDVANTSKCYIPMTLQDDDTLHNL